MHLSMLPNFLVISTLVISIDAFALISSTACTRNQIRNPRCESVSVLHESPENSDLNDQEKKLITKEMFLRDMLSDPESVNLTDGNEVLSSANVRRKKKNGSRYRTVDNRDSLPFLVKTISPDPYTSNAAMKEEAKLNSSRHENKNKNGVGRKKRKNLVGMDGKDSISSSIYSRDAEGSMHKIVGEFALDKSTNCGDIIEIGDGTEYQVQKSRCQYKYAGGQKFIMTRKILEVKELKRVVVEKEVHELFEKEIDEDIDGLDGFTLE